MPTKASAKPKPAAKVARTKKPSAAPAKPAAPKESCFTIMPFGGWFDDYYESVYKPAIEASGLKPKRADDLYRPSTIVTDIWSYTKAAKLVLADLTGKNPNVFYELGLAHALAKPVVLVAESMSDVPFDLRALRVIEYDKNEPRWGDTLRDKIVLSIGEVLASPLTSVPSAFIEAKPTTGAKPISEQERTLLELRQEVDVLRRELRVSNSHILSDDAQHLVVPDSHRITDSHEARALLMKYLAMGMPSDVITRRLADRGVPNGWVVRELKVHRPNRTTAKRATK